ncbi:MAG: glycerophosphodiester phosphodiesterase family protein [Candidatus Saccharimonadales bacterium]
MDIIGHRGAAGLALENTLESIIAATEAGVDGVEVDVRVTKDKKLVLSHDRNTGRVSAKTVSINSHSLAALKKLMLHNGGKMASLGDAYKAAGGTSLVVEGKDDGWARPLALFMQRQTKPLHCKVISFNHQELYTFSLLMPRVPTYALEKTKPFDVMHTAKLLGFTGVNLNFWILNPVTYLLAKRYKLEIIVYTVDKPWMARFLRILYPKISITTNVPHKMQFLRAKQQPTKS